MLKKIQAHSSLKDLLVKKAKKDGKSSVNEVHGWSADREDWNIVGGTLDPKKQYSAVKLWSGSGYLLTLFVTEYKEYLPDMVEDIYNAFGKKYPECFPSIDEYYDVVKTWREDIDKDPKYKDEDEVHRQMRAEEYAEESILPMWDCDGDICIWAENAYFSKPMSGEEVEKQLSEL